VRSSPEPPINGCISVFAVEDTSTQLSWSCLPSPDLSLEIAGRRFPVGGLPPPWYQTKWGRRPAPGRAGPGAITVGGLEPATSYDVCLVGPRWPRRLVASVRTLPPPPGRLLYRFATVSDCHLGERRLGFLKRLHDPRPRPFDLVPYPLRCAEAAIRSAAAWGAELLVVKGDLTNKGAPAEIFEAIDLLRSAPMPVEVILGNHDVRGRLNVAAVMAGGGLEVAVRARSRDLPGARLVLGHSPIPDYHKGEVPAAHAAELAALAAEAAGPVVVALHHPPQRWPVQTHYPPSITRSDSNRLVSALVEANRSTLLIAGHTHRNRRYRVAGLTVSEVGSTKDYPGQWAGYAVYEGGIRQVVFRVDEPDAMAWTQTTARAVGGIWKHWSPGRLRDRSWTLEWPDRVVAAA
jgi:predicted phosphodiesterase